MNYKNSVIVLVLILVIAGWYFFDHRNVALTSTPDYYSTEQDSVSDTSETQVTPSLIASSTSHNIHNNSTKNSMHTITLETSKGTIVFETYDNDAPKTSQNFVDLAHKGFYNGVIFHRIISGFMIQGGDPTGTGMGGPGYKFADELNPQTESYKKGYVRGTVAMANSGPNTNGSQFFIMHKDNPLPNLYTIFGRVISGLDVVDAIAAAATDGNDRPLEDIIIKKVTVQDK